MQRQCICMIIWICVSLGHYVVCLLWENSHLKTGCGRSSSAGIWGYITLHNLICVLIFFTIRFLFRVSESRETLTSLLQDVWWIITVTISHSHTFGQTQACMSLLVLHVIRSQGEGVRPPFIFLFGNKTALPWHCLKLFFISHNSLIILKWTDK